MKKHAALLLAVVMLLALAAPAAAKPPNCDETPWHPACGGANDEPAPAGTACSEVTDGYIATVNDGHIEFTLEGDFACIDVSNISPTGAWDITYNVTAGTLRELLVLVRDSFSPGDICNYGMRLRHVSSGGFFLEPNAADYVNSCGTEFAEIVNGVYRDDADPDAPSPLAFLVFTRGTKDLVVDFTVDYPSATP